MLARPREVRTPPQLLPFKSGAVRWAAATVSRSPPVKAQRRKSPSGFVYDRLRGLPRFGSSIEATECAASLLRKWEQPRWACHGNVLRRASGDHRTLIWGAASASSVRGERAGGDSPLRVSCALLLLCVSEPWVPPSISHMHDRRPWIRIPRRRSTHGSEVEGMASRRIRRTWEVCPAFRSVRVPK